MPSTADARRLYLRLLLAWNERDARGMADCFADDGVMIGFDGSLVEGRAKIAEHLAPIFADHPTAEFVTVIRSVRAIDADHILLADVGMVPPGRSELVPETMARQSLVTTAASGGTDQGAVTAADTSAGAATGTGTGTGTDGGVRIALFQNTPTALHMDPEHRAALFDELSEAYLERGALPL